MSIPGNAGCSSLVIHIHVRAHITFRVYEKSILKIESTKAKFQTDIHELPTKDETESIL